MSLREIYQKHGSDQVQKGQPAPGRAVQAHDTIELESPIQAVKISSQVLEDTIWLILDRSFIPNDGLACYYPEEIPLLKGKTSEELREIHKVKLAFPGARVIQEGAEKQPPMGQASTGKPGDTSGEALGEIVDRRAN